MGKKLSGEFFLPIDSVVLRKMLNKDNTWLKTNMPLLRFSKYSTVQKQKTKNKKQNLASLPPLPLHHSLVFSVFSRQERVIFGPLYFFLEKDFLLSFFFS